MITQKITSLANPRIKRVVRLRQHRHRREEGLMIVEGERELARALAAGVVFQELYVSGKAGDEFAPGSEFMMARDILNKAGEMAATSSRNVKVLMIEASHSVFAKMAYGRKEVGILAVCEIPKVDFSNFKKAKCPLFVVVEAVEKPGNLGAILRTCDGAGVTGVILCDEKTDMFNPNVIRASLGAVFSVSSVVASREEVLNFLKSKKVKICATLPRAKRVYTRADLAGPLAIVMGSEQEGLSEFWADQADSHVRIPMKGKVDSLNVSASTAILLYEVLRQRDL